MPEEATTATAAQTTSDGTAQNTGAGQTAGAATEAAQTSQAAQTDITQTAEFKSALTAAIEKKLPQLRKQIAKEVSGEKEGQPSVDELTQRATTAEQRARQLEAKDAVFDYADDPKNKIGLRPDSRKSFWAVVKDDLEYDDEGRVTNLAAVVRAARSDHPALFTPTSGSINGGAGASQPAGSPDMNRWIRQAAGRQ